MTIIIYRQLLTMDLIYCIYNVTMTKGTNRITMKETLYVTYITKEFTESTTSCPSLC